MTTDSTPPADDQAARYEAELSRWAEKNVELAAENIDLRARVAVVRALRDKYAVENAQLQQARRNRIGVYGHNDAYALVAHVVSELDAVLDGPAEAAEPATFQERAERFGREFAAGMAEGIGASEAAEPAATPNQLQAAPTLGVAEAGAPEPGPHDNLYEAAGKLAQHLDTEPEYLAHGVVDLVLRMQAEEAAGGVSATPETPTAAAPAGDRWGLAQPGTSTGGVSTTPAAPPSFDWQLIGHRAQALANACLHCDDEALVLGGLLAMVADAAGCVLRPAGVSSTPDPAAPAWPLVSDLDKALDILGDPLDPAVSVGDRAIAYSMVRRVRAALAGTATTPEETT